MGVGWVGEGTAPPPPSLKNTSAPKFASQGDVHVTTDAQIKFLYYPVCVNILYIIYIYIYIYILENNVC